MPMSASLSPSQEVALLAPERSSLVKNSASTYAGRFERSAWIRRKEKDSAGGRATITFVTRHEPGDLRLPRSVRQRRCTSMALQA